MGLNDDELPTEAPGEEESKETVEIPEAEDTASSRIRDQVSKMLPEIARQGKDPSEKKTRAAIVKELAKSENVSYNTAGKAYDSALKKSGTMSGATTIQPAPAPSQHTVGGVTAIVRSKPKIVPAETEQRSEAASSPETKPTCEKCGTPYSPALVDGEEQHQFSAKCGHELGKPKGVMLTEQQLDELLSDTIEFPTEMLYKIVEKAWNVKVEDKPDEDDYKRLGVRWGEVIRAYGVDVPKAVMLLTATASTISVIALPVVLARGEMMEREKKKNLAEEEAKKKPLPELKTVEAKAAPAPQTAAPPKPMEARRPTPPKGKGKR